MELVCIDKQTFEELRIRFCKFEERMTHICRPVEDLGLKNWLDNQEVCDVLRINKKTLQAYRAKGCLLYTSGVPLELNYLLGKKNSKLELGFGASLGIYRVKGEVAYYNNLEW